MQPPVTHAYIWVLPKSGTMFMIMFFRIYNIFLHNEVPADLDIFNSNIDMSIYNKTAFKITHGECPGLQQAATDPHKLALWNSFAHNKMPPWDGNWHERQKISQQMLSSDPEFLDQCRIVFIFRNPLDQLVSYWKYMHRLPSDDKQIKPDETKFPFSLEEFIFKHHILEGYIKMYYSYHVVSQKYPQQILCIPYEQIMRNKPATLRKIIDHLELPYNEAAFVKAMEFTTKENLHRIENKFNTSLVGSTDNSRHIRNGGIGVWQEHMTPEMVQRIEDKLQEFGLSLEMFHLADELKPEFSFLMEDKANSARLRVRL